MIVGICILIQNGMLLGMWICFSHGKMIKWVSKFIVMRRTIDKSYNCIPLFVGSKTLTSKFGECKREVGDQLPVKTRLVWAYNQWG
ncbi:hypothetical protein COD67_16815 [Bacillus cereus]|nr:hypothetical protein COD67_16815 [Bacillus cereus]